jgi:predicted nucleotidyltransferase
LLQKFAFDIPLAAAALLGRDAAAIAEKATIERILEIAERETATDALALAVDMGKTAADNLALLEALLAGLQDNAP